MPAQEANRSGVPNTAMSTPTSAISASATRLSTPGMVTILSTWWPKGAITRSISSDSEPMISSRKSSLARIEDTSRAWWLLKRPSNASRSAGILARSLPRASSASTSGSRVPRTRALSMSRPDLPKISVATEESFTPASWRTLSRRWASRPRSSIWALR